MKRLYEENGTAEAQRAAFGEPRPGNLDHFPRKRIRKGLILAGLVIALAIFPLITSAIIIPQLIFNVTTAS